MRWGRYVFITPERVARAEAFFARHGGKAVFLARFFSGLRVFGALVAGISRMRWAAFLAYNALGGAVWATVVVLGNLAKNCPAYSRSRTGRNAECESPLLLS